MNGDHEELEHIPWSELMAGDEPENRRLLYLGAGLVAALAVGMLVGRSLWPSGGPGPVTIAADTVTEQTTSATASTAVETTVPATVTTAPAVQPDTTTIEVTTTTIEPTTTLPSAEPPVLYSEADLRTVPEEAFVRAAIARAEWFVTDYFTADSEDNGVADILGALPAGTELPPMPQEQDVGVTYVEWARAFRVEPEGDGRYTVAVMFRSLASPEGGAYYRVPMRAVEVTVAVGADGGTTVLDLPSAARLPDGPAVLPWHSDPAAPPVDVAADAEAIASAWGSEPSVLSATLESDGWRVVVAVGDEIGSRWPVVVVVPVE
jgi:hypothetical protein